MSKHCKRCTDQASNWVYACHPFGPFPCDPWLSRSLGSQPDRGCGCWIRAYTLYLRLEGVGFLLIRFVFFLVGGGRIRGLWFRTLQLPGCLLAACLQQRHGGPSCNLKLIQNWTPNKRLVFYPFPASLVSSRSPSKPTASGSFPGFLCSRRWSFWFPCAFARVRSGPCPRRSTTKSWRYCRRTAS